MVDSGTVAGHVALGQKAIVLSRSEQAEARNDEMAGGRDGAERALNSLEVEAQCKVHDVLCVPARPTGARHPLGVATLINKKSPFSSGDVRLLSEFFAHVASLMMATVQRWQAEHTQEQLGLLLKASRQLLLPGASSDPKALLLGFLAAAVALTGAERLTIYLADDKKGQVWGVHSHSSCLETDEIAGEWSAPGNIVAQVLATGVVVHADASPDGAFVPAEDELQGFSTSHILAVPLSAQPRQQERGEPRTSMVPGVVVARMSAAGARFTPRDVELFSTLCGIFSHTLLLSQSRTVVWAILLDKFNSK